MERENGKPFGLRDGMGVHRTGSWNGSGTGREIGWKDIYGKTVGNIVGNMVGNMVRNIVGKSVVTPVRILPGDAVRNSWEHDRESGLETTVEKRKAPSALCQLIPLV